MTAMSSRLLRYGAIAAATLVVLTIGVLAYRSLQVPYQAPTVASPLPAAGGCKPAPCADQVRPAVARRVRSGVSDDVL